MNEYTNRDGYGMVPQPGTLKIERLLPGPIQRVWSHLSESGLRRRWLAAGELPAKVGSPVEFVWRNDELNDPPSQRPAGFPEEQRMHGRIIAFNPPRSLSIAWDGFGELSYFLEEKADQVLLTMTQRGLPSRDIVVMFASGSHMHLDILEALLIGATPPQFWDGWSRLQEEYGERLPR